MALVLDGKACAQAIEAELKTEISTLAVTPKLVLILVGSNPDSKTYIRLKKNACTRVGIAVDVVELVDDTTYEQLVGVIHEKNADSTVHGVLVQLPLPEPLQVKEQAVLHTIVPEKDVDGLHPAHFYQLPMAKTEHSEHVLLEPCTPAGCLELLARNNIDVADKDVVMVGRGQLVGLPLTLMLLQRNATVTTCHTHTKDLEDKVRRADVVIVGVGKPELIKGDWIKPGAVVVDVGINYVDDATSKKGYKILGDVEYEAAKAKASAITPVPGGIGPMTVAMLLKNTMKSAKFVQITQ
ncbi:hypothetical protein Poli38472_005726 [Pythium oligandrum]|uniref:Methenyltetrahydrofolate cyclohydrolase n=1 Tax=Pythium oligandrum TaxID=41045 RepID=A0A8K1CU09_PYTOL|nr:hypothetical protein Poli38472_005726 [Pythium oligandrum]|eukprot:TMW68258.1 hypothetical protein Poli38472_005726 [Pythium oligandrum]